MSIDVVVVNFHSAPLIGRTLEVAREFGGEAARIIMVDNSPSDGAARLVRRAEPDAVVITNPTNRGYAAAVNQAMAVAHADTVLLLNPDVQRITGGATKIAHALRDPRIAAVVPRLVSRDGSLQRSCRRAPRPFDLLSEDVALAERFPGWQRPRRHRMLDWDYSDCRRVDAATGACLFLRRAAVADVGPFDERFFVYYEETDWMIRAKIRGWRRSTCRRSRRFTCRRRARPVATRNRPCCCSRASIGMRESTSGRARRCCFVRRCLESTAPAWRGMPSPAGETPGWRLWAASAST